MSEKNDKFSILSSKDILILEKLIEDGRKTSASISKEIDLGREIVNYRIKRLIKENLIVKFIPKINNISINYKEYVILLKLNMADEVSKENFIKEQIGNKYLIWIVKQKGNWDLVIRLYASSLDEFKKKLNEILSNFQNTIARYYTIMSIDEIKENEKDILAKNLFENEFSQKDFKEIKKSADFVNIDEKDKQIIKLLEENGREQYSDIASKLNVSSDTIKYRIEKMKNNGIIENFKPVINFNKIGFFEYCCIIKFSYLNENSEKEFYDYINFNKNIIKAIKNLNGDEFFLNLVFQKKEEEKIFISEIKDLFKKNIDFIDLFLLE